MLRYPSIRPVFTPRALPQAGPVQRAPKTPRIPFFRDPAHTVPTKWSLYRPLLRRLGFPGRGKPIPSASKSRLPADPLAPSYDDILPALRARWRRARGNTSIPRARVFIESEEALLSALDDPGALSALSDTAAAQLLAAYKAPPPPAPTPRYTGSFMRPTILNPPLPRLKPQPIKISMMMKKRLKLRAQRVERHRELMEINSAMKYEVGFWRSLGAGDRSGADAPDAEEWIASDWGKEANKAIGLLEGVFERDARRAASVFTPETVEQVMAARRRRHAFYNERARERRERRDKEVEEEEKEKGKKDQTS